MSPDPAPCRDPEELIVSNEQAGQRLDRFVALSLPSLSRAYVQHLIDDGAVTLGDRPAKASARLKAGDRVSLTIPPPLSVALAATSIPLDVVYEDEDVLVIDKAAGMVVHPAPGHADDTLVNALLARYPDLQIGPALRPGIVHRLDKDTSGLMVVAKNDRAMASLARQLKERTVLKEYLALVEGRLPAHEGIIEAPIGRHPRERKRMAVLPGGREARTRFVVQEAIGNHSLLRVRLETGRTHQIRVHLTSIGHPLEGDRVYGRRGAHCPGLDRQFLHASRLGFSLPGSGANVEFSAELPADLERCLAALRTAEGGGTGGTFGN